MSANRTPKSIIEELLTSRGIQSGEQAHFLKPDFVTDQHDASIMLGMSVAVKRLAEAAEKKERVVVFGDYDADGVPATALLYRTLTPLGITIVPRIPRRSEGYGLTMDAVEQIISLKPDLLVAVDNGTVASAEITALKTAGIQTIVIDHHEPQEGQVATDALAIINPKQGGCTYPFKEMCACALAWKVVDILYSHMGRDRGVLKWELDLVALSTVADMVPLVGENRLFTIYGLKVLKKTRNEGLRALAEVSGLELPMVSASDLSFRLAPRINAPSRMHQDEQEGAHVSLSLLIATDKEKARALASTLNQANTDRQRLVDNHLEQALEQAQNQKDQAVIVVYHESWSSGVIGLVASKLLDQYRRPAVVLAPEGSEIKGSVRTIDGVHALELLTAGSAHLLRYGGHAKAAGLTLTGDIAQFRSTLNEWAKVQAGEQVSTVDQGYKREDMVLEPGEVTLDLANVLETLEPFGVGFPTPLFRISAQFASLRRVGSQGQHLSGFLTAGDTQLKIIAFMQPDTPLPDESYNVWFSLKAEEWRMVRSPVCQVQRWRIAD